MVAQPLQEHHITTMDVPFVFYNHQIAHSELGTSSDVEPFGEEKAATLATTRSRI